MQVTVCDQCLAPTKPGCVHVTARVDGDATHGVYTADVCDFTCAARWFDRVRMARDYEALTKNGAAAT